MPWECGSATVPWECHGSMVMPQGHVSLINTGDRNKLCVSVRPMNVFPNNILLNKLIIKHPNLANNSNLLLKKFILKRLLNVLERFTYGII